MFSHQCVLDMKGYSEHSNSFKNIEKILPMIHFWWKNSLMSTNVLINRVSELVKKARNEFRISQGVDQDRYVTLFAPGNESN